MRPDASPCPGCGAIGCAEKYGQMLALEFGQPTVFGAVHHITVTCYNLQHPDAFTDEALAWMRSSLRAILTEDLSGPEFRKRARKTLDDDVKIKRRTAPAENRTRVPWSMTVNDVCTDSPEVYVHDIKAWAQSILRDIDRARQD